MWLWVQVFITGSEIILQRTAEVGGAAQYQVSHQAVNINWNSLCSEFKHIVMFSSAVVFRLSSWSLFRNINISFLLPGIRFEMRTLLYWIITEWDWFLINNVYVQRDDKRVRLKQILQIICDSQKHGYQCIMYESY